LERGVERRAADKASRSVPVGLAAFGALLGPGGGDLVVVELQEVVGRCC
jgi:hypothetical protein